MSWNKVMHLDRFDVEVQKYMLLYTYRSDGIIFNKGFRGVRPLL